MNGKFIVLDGGDGAGKKTQLDLLKEKLRDEGYHVETADFPQYGNWSAQFVERYLNGEFGSSQAVNSKKASLFYALDRLEASSRIKKWLDQGIIVLSNRYVSANKGHQLGKIQDSKEMHAFLAWLNDLEYNTMGIPIPDLTLFLHMTPEIGQKLVDSKDARAYLKDGKTRDIHEDDINHLRNAERAYLFCLENDPIERWRKITCFKETEPKNILEIHKEIYLMVKETIKK